MAGGLGTLEETGDTAGGSPVPQMSLPRGAGYDKRRRRGNGFVLRRMEAVAGR